MGKLFDTRHRCETGERLHRDCVDARFAWFSLSQLSRYDECNAYIARRITSTLEALNAHEEECEICGAKSKS